LALINKVNRECAQE
jgi:hypothetical protein